MLAKDILKSARYILSDTNTTRWSDERLLELLNEGLLEIALKTIIFTRTVYLGISNAVVDYDLSDTVAKLKRIEYLGEPLPLCTFEEMDKKDADWQTRTGTKPEAVVYNHQKNGQFKIYPIVSNAENSHMVFTQTYGIMTYISYVDVEFLLEDVYGDLGSLVQTGYLKLFYVRKHTTITDINATIDADTLIKQPLAHYIAGRALRDNRDAQNRAVGNEELGIYESSLAEYANEKANSYGTVRYEVPYSPNGV